MKLLVRVIFQAEVQGNLIKDVLFSIADTIRARQRHKIQDKANRLGNTMIFPVMVFMVPPVMVIYTLPAILNLSYLM